MSLEWAKIHSISQILHDQNHNSANNVNIFNERAWDWGIQSWKPSFQEEYLDFENKAIILSVKWKAELLDINDQKWRIISWYKGTISLKRNLYYTPDIEHEVTL